MSIIYPLQVKPPIIPDAGKPGQAALNFDEEFTSQNPVITPTAPNYVKDFIQVIYEGFDFTAN